MEFREGTGGVPPCNMGTGLILEVDAFGLLLVACDDPGNK
jgi:hypothetical protein